MRMVRWNPAVARNAVAKSGVWNNDPFFGLMNDFLAQDNVGNTLDVDIHEKDDHYVLTAEIPGVKKEDLKINVEGDVLTIEAEKRSEFEDDKEGVYHAERTYGKFSRSFRLNSQIEGDKIEAKYSDGVLRLTMPKKEEVKGRSITIK